MRRLLLCMTLALLASPAFAQFKIPDQTSGSILSTNQSIPMAGDIDTIVAGASRVGVLSGLAVTAQGSPNMTVAVAAGTVRVGTGTLYKVAAGTGTITSAHASLDRIDLVVITSAGAISVIAGTPAANPGYPAITSNAVLIAAVYVTHAITSITSSAIVDKRWPVHGDTVFNVQDYGAVPDGTTDSTSAIQAAINAAQASNTGAVLLPAGPSCYKITSPLSIVGTYLLHFFGTAQTAEHGSCITASGYYGPMIFMRGATAVSAMSYTSGLTSSGGSALSVTAGDPTTWVDMTDMGAPLRINGYNAFAVEGFIKTTGIASGSYYKYICDSSGTATNQSDRTSAFYVRTSQDGRIRGAMNISGTMTEIYSNTGVVTDGTTLHFALTFDGSTVRLFYGAPGATTTLAMSANTAGTLQIGPYETWNCGGGTRTLFPHGPAQEAAQTGTYDSIRFSSTVRHTSTYTAPNVKYSYDGSTLALWNFDNESSDFSQMTVNGNVQAYLPKRSISGYTQNTGPEIDHIAFIQSGGAAIQNIGIVGGYYHDLTFEGGQYGFDCHQDCYLSRFDRISGVGNGATTMINLVGQDGISYVCNINSFGYKTTLHFGGGSGEVCNIYNSGGQSVWPVILASGEYTVNGVAVSSEDADGAVWKGSVFLYNVTGTVFNGGFIESIQNNTPLIGVYQGGSISFVGTAFVALSGTTKIIDIRSAPSQPVMVLNATKNQSSPPWATDSNVVVWPSLLKGAPTISSGFGTSPTVASGSSAEVLHITVGSGSPSSGVIAFPNPPAPHAWVCYVQNITAQAAHVNVRTYQTNFSTTTATLENQNSSGAATAWTTGDELYITCDPQ